MFKSNDKLTLSLINATDIEGKYIPFSLKLPLEDKQYELPKNITSIDGGYTSKIGGQINMLILNENKDRKKPLYDFYSVDDLKQVEVVKTTKGKKASIIAIWDRERFKIIIKGKSKFVIKKT